MSTINDGGSVFPLPAEQSEKQNFATQGITLRDYFASAAMQGWIATYSGEYGHPAEADGGARRARLSYAMADAMIAERSKR